MDLGQEVSQFFINLRRICLVRVGEEGFALDLLLSQKGQVNTGLRMSHERGGIPFILTATVLIGEGDIQIMFKGNLVFFFRPVLLAF